MLPSDQNARTEETKLVLDKETGKYKRIPVGEVDDDRRPCEVGDLAKMPHADLLSLAQRICDARWGEVAQMTREQRIEAAKLKLWHAGLTEVDIHKAIPALDRALDRDVGKPPQQQTLDMNVKGAVMSISLTDKQILEDYFRTKMLNGSGDAA